MSRFRLAVFDVDGTLTRIESCWQFIHERLDTWEKGGKVNAQLYFSGKISYDDWARLDAVVALGNSSRSNRKIGWSTPPREEKETINMRRLCIFHGKCFRGYR